MEIFCSPNNRFFFFQSFGMDTKFGNTHNPIPQTQIHHKLCLRWNQRDNPFWWIRKGNGAIELVYELGHGELVIGYLITQNLWLDIQIT